MSNMITAFALDKKDGAVIANLTNFGAPYDIKALPDGFVVADYAVGRLTKVAAENIAAFKAGKPINVVN